MKKQITVFTLVMVTLFSATSIVRGQDAKKDPCAYYFSRVSNPSKTTNYLFALYVGCHLEHQGASDSAHYTRIQAAIINQSATDLSWNNYKVFVQLKSGQLIRNYTTSATSGDYANTFTVAGNTTDHKYFCFHATFSFADISKIWLTLNGDDQVFDLNFSDDKS